MIGNAEERICSGCYEVIASHDPEAYQRDLFYYHCKAHENMHAARNWNAFLTTEGERSREVFGTAYAATGR